MSSVLFSGSYIALAQVSNSSAGSQDISALQQKLASMKEKLAELQGLAKSQESEQAAYSLTANDLNSLESSLVALRKTLAVIKEQLKDNKLSDKTAMAAKLIVIKSSLTNINELVMSSNSLAQSPMPVQKNYQETTKDTRANQQAETSDNNQLSSVNTPIETETAQTSASNQASASSLLSKIMKRQVILPAVIVILIIIAAVIWFSRPKEEKREEKKRIATA